jgi:pimeloyl-ACP methyl ester carboxylesterase
MVAQELAVDHPDKVNRLILYGSPCGGNESAPAEEEVVITPAIESGSAAERIARFILFLFPQEWWVAIQSTI